MLFDRRHWFLGWAFARCEALLRQLPTSWQVACLVRDMRKRKNSGVAGEDSGEVFCGTHEERLLRRCDALGVGEYVRAQRSKGRLLVVSGDVSHARLGM